MSPMTQDQHVYNTVTSDVEIITPDVAEVYLKYNEGNRHKKQAKIEAYARDMADGNWTLNGSAIQFDYHGRLIDGQNRLEAVILSGVDTPFLVVRGLDPRAQDHIDRGSSRTLGDAFSMRSEPLAHTLASALSIIWRLRHGKERYGITATNAELLDLLDQEPDIRHSLGWHADPKSLVSQATLAAFHYEFARRDRPLADEMMTKLTKGADISRHEPVYLLRVRLLNNLAAKAKLPRTEVWALLIKTWNALRSGEKVRFLRWRHEGDAPEPFPAIQ